MATSNEIDTIAYAISFSEAAKRLPDGPTWPDHTSLIVPFFMLIGFSIENALKAYLEHKQFVGEKKWSHSHDLSWLRQLCGQQGFEASPAAVDFIDHLSPMHKDHQFRYPQKAQRVHLPQPGTALGLLEELLTAIFIAIEGHKGREVRF